MTRRDKGTGIKCLHCRGLWSFFLKIDENTLQCNKCGMSVHNHDPYVYAEPWDYIRDHSTEADIKFFNELMLVFK